MEIPDAWMFDNLEFTEYNFGYRFWYWGVLIKAQWHATINISINGALLRHR
jgi:hypothetical protein